MTGYEGAQCSQCAMGSWHSQATFNCYECAEHSELLFALQVTLLIAALIWLCLVFSRTISSRINHETIPLVRIFLNMSHMLCILNGMVGQEHAFEASRLMQRVLDLMTQVLMPFSSILDLTCFSSASTTSDLGLGVEMISSEETQMLELKLLATLPIIIIIICAIISLILACRAEKFKFEHLMRHVIGQIGVIMFVAQPSIMIGLIQAT